MKAMKAIILAAGRGSRIQGMTDDKPKCLTRLAGKTLLDWQLLALNAMGIDHIAVVRGYLAEQLQSKRFSSLDNPRWPETNMVVTLTCASALLLNDTCIVSYADIVYNASHIEKLILATGDIVLTYDRLWESLWQERFTDPLSDAETFKEKRGQLLEIGDKAQSMTEIAGQYMGLLKFTPKGWKIVEKQLNKLSQNQLDRLDMTALLRLLLEQGVAINVVPVEGKWCEVDSEHDLRLYENKISQVDKSDRYWMHDWRGKL
jgi:choline kinase